MIGWSKNMKWSTVFVGLTCAMTVLGVACDDPAPVGQGLGGAGDAPQVPTAAAAAVEAKEPEEKKEKATPQFRDDQFVEADASRDPFRSFADMFRVRPVERPQRAVVMPTTGVDEMRLSAIITGVARPRAMLVDPVGVGHVVQRGDFVGRPEVVQTGGTESMPVTLNWRVDRVRPNEVVLTRDDPTAPERPPLTRVIPLYEDSERRPVTL